MNLQDLGFLGITGFILLAFILIGFFKGLIHTILGMICLSFAGYSVFKVHRHAYLAIETWAGDHRFWLSWVIAIFAGFCALMLSRYLMKFLIDPFNTSKAGQRIGFGLPAAAIALVIGCLSIWLGLAGIRFAGCLAELQDTRHKIANRESEKTTASKLSRHATPLLLQARQQLEKSDLGEWHRAVDLFHHPEKTRLCTILILYHHAPSRETMLSHMEFNTLLNGAAFLELVHQEEIKALALSSYPAQLYTTASVTKALDNKQLVQVLQTCDPGQILEPAEP